MMNRCIVVLLAFGMLAACQQTSNAPSTTSFTAIALTQAVSTASPTLTHRETAGPGVTNAQTPGIPPTDSVPSTRLAPTQLSSTPGSGIGVTRYCLDVGSVVSLRTVAIEGIAVLLPLDFPYYVLDLTTGEQQPLPYVDDQDVLLTGIGSSPNGSYLAYVLSVRNQEAKVVRRLFWVVTSDGTVQVERDFPLDWGGFYWLDNEWLQVGALGRPSGTWIIYNAFTGEWYEQSPDLPDLYDDYYQSIARSDWTVRYSPGLEWAVYLTNPSPLPESISSIVVWDTVAQRAIWQSKGSHIAFYPPEWSPSRQLVAAVIEGTIHLLDRTGLVTTLAGLPQLEDVRAVSWSPDERYLAYWTELPDFSDDPYKAQLFVYDRQHKRIADYCLQVADFSDDGSRTSWSPDSRQFVIRGVVVQADGTVHDQPVLVDLAQKTAVQISESEFSGIWLKFPP